MQQYSISPDAIRSFRKKRTSYLLSAVTFLTILVIIIQLLFITAPGADTGFLIFLIPAMAFYMGLAVFRLFEKRYLQLISYKLTIGADAFTWEMNNKAITIPFSAVTSIQKFEDDGKIIINGKNWRIKVIIHPFIEDHVQLEAWLRQRWVITDEISPLWLLQHDWSQIILCTIGLITVAIKETNSSRIVHMIIATVSLLTWGLRASDPNGKSYRAKSNFNILAVVVLLVIALYVTNAGFFQAAKTAY